MAPIRLFGIVVAVLGMVSADTCGYDDAVLDAELHAQRAAWQKGHITSHTVARASAHARSRFFEVAAGTPRPLRIRFFTQDLDDEGAYCLDGKRPSVRDFKGGTIACRGESDLTLAKRKFLVEQLLPEATSQLAALLNVVPREGNLHVDHCGPPGGEMTVPASHQKSNAGVSDADFVLYVASAPATAAAWAGACAFHSDDMQPYAGRANFDPASLDPDRLLADAVGLAVHEMMHALGFTRSFFGNSDSGHPQKRIPLQNVTNRRGLDFVTVLAGPASIREARRFYLCDDLEGIELENEGGPGSRGSHMERRVAYDDAMGASGGLGISRMTLAVFEDLGYYTPNYDALETDPRFSGRQPQFGRGRGCDFVREKCNTVAGGMGREFCFTEMSEVGCAPDASGMRQCSIGLASLDFRPEFRYFDDPRRGGSTPFMDGCPTFTTFNDCAESTNGFPGQVGDDSRCVVGVNFGTPAAGMLVGKLPRCHVTLCFNGSLHLVGKGEKTAVCSAAGETVTPPGHIGHLICPDLAVCPTARDGSSRGPSGSGGVGNGGVASWCGHYCWAFFAGAGALLLVAIASVVLVVLLRSRTEPEEPGKKTAGAPPTDTVVVPSTETAFRHQDDAGDWWTWDPVAQKWCVDARGVDREPVATAAADTDVFWEQDDAGAWWYWNEQHSQWFPYEA